MPGNNPGTVGQSGGLVWEVVLLVGLVEKGSLYSLCFSWDLEE